MRIFFVLTAFASFLIALDVGRAPEAVEANACRLVEMPDPENRLRHAASDAWTEIVLVGVVGDEVDVVLDDDAPNNYRPLRDGEAPDPYGLFQSTVRVDAVLKGSVPGDELVLTGLSPDYQCAQAPRLPEGERVLLLIGKFPNTMGNQNPEDFTWQTNLLGGQAFFAGESAVMADYPARAGDTYLGRPEEVVLEVASIVGASEAETNAAISALSAPIAAEDDRGDQWWVSVVAAVLTVALAAVAIILMHRRTTA